MPGKYKLNIKRRVECLHLQGMAAHISVCLFTGVLVKVELRRDERPGQRVVVTVIPPGLSVVELRTCLSVQLLKIFSTDEATELTASRAEMQRRTRESPIAENTTDEDVSSLFILHFILSGWL